MNSFIGAVAGMIGGYQVYKAVNTEVTRRTYDAVPYAITGSVIVLKMGGAAFDAQMFKYVAGSTVLGAVFLISTIRRHNAF